MENRGMDVRESLHILAEQLPEGASWEDAIERIRFRQAVEEGKAAARSGDFASEAEVNQVSKNTGIRVSRIR